MKPSSSWPNNIFLFLIIICSTASENSSQKWSITVDCDLIIYSLNYFASMRGFTGSLSQSTFIVFRLKRRDKRREKVPVEAFADVKLCLNRFVELVKIILGKVILFNAPDSTLKRADLETAIYILSQHYIQTTKLPIIARRKHIQLVSRARKLQRTIRFPKHGVYFAPRYFTLLLEHGSC